MILLDKEDPISISTCKKLLKEYNPQQAAEEAPD
jgi:hypothetical protein